VHTRGFGDFLEDRCHGFSALRGSRWKTWTRAPMGLHAVYEDLAARQRGRVIRRRSARARR
jgi:hypothetical protein